MITDIIDENELKSMLARWLIDNDRSVILPSGSSIEDFVSDFKLPDIKGEHTQSTADADGNITTLLKHEIRLKDWETKSGKECRFIYYSVLKSSAENPDIEPFTEGYIAVY